MRDRYYSKVILFGEYSMIFDATEKDDFAIVSVSHHSSFFGPSPTWSAIQRSLSQ